MFEMLVLHFIQQTEKGMEFGIERMTSAYQEFHACERNDAANRYELFIHGLQKMTINKLDT